MPAPPPYSGSHYYFTPEGWRSAAPRLTNITGAGSEAAIATLAAGHVADEASDAARAAARARWGARAQVISRVGGRPVIVVGMASSGYEIYTADNRAKETSEQVGGWAGALSGGYAGGLGGSSVGLWGAIAGGLLGGVAGFFAGSQAGENYYEFFFESGMVKK